MISGRHSAVGEVGDLPLVIVVAVAQNGVIGRDNDLPWRQRTDLRRFKALTLGKPMIVGRRNWEAIGRPLPGRELIVLTRRPDYVATGARVASSWPDAKRIALEAARAMEADAIVIGGGAEIYAMALPETARIHLTQIEARPDGDVLFPAYEADAFRETLREIHPAGPDDDHPFTFVDLVRIAPDRARSTDAAGR